jgi:hypothetical protein
MRNAMNGNGHDGAAWEKSMTGEVRLDFVGIGPQRAGTTWLHLVLGQHPGLCFPADVKETMFFDQYYARGLAWYARYFDHRAAGQLLGEIAPTYFDVPDAPERIALTNPVCKVIVNLRQPLARTLSLHRHHFVAGRVDACFRSAVRAMPRLVESSHYAAHVPRWIARFGRERLLFVLLDDIASAPEPVFRTVLAFLGLDDIPLPPEGLERLNQAISPRFRRLAKATASVVSLLHANRLHKLVNAGKAIGLRRLVYRSGGSGPPPPSKEERAELMRTFEPDITYVEKLLGRDLSAWRDVR